MVGECRVVWRDPAHRGPEWTAHRVVDVVDAEAARVLVDDLRRRGMLEVHWWEVASEGE